MRVSSRGWQFDLESQSVACGRVEFRNGICVRAGWKQIWAIKSRGCWTSSVLGGLCDSNDEDTGLGSLAAWQRQPSRVPGNASDRVVMSTLETKEIDKARKASLASFDRSRDEKGNLDIATFDAISHVKTSE